MYTCCSVDTTTCWEEWENVTEKLTLRLLLKLLLTMGKQRFKNSDKISKSNSSNFLNSYLLVIEMLYLNVAYFTFGFKLLILYITNVG